MQLSMNDEEQFFLKTVGELRSRFNSRDEHAWTRASALLRQLLLDHPTLLAQANRRHRLKIRFPVPSLSALNPNGFALRGFGSSGPPGELVQASLKHFLGCHCLAVNGEVFSVCDVIKITAHVLGGVHRGMPDDAHELALSSVSKSEMHCSFGSEAGHIALAMLPEITIATLAGLQPLVIAIEQGHSRPQLNAGAQSPLCGVCLKGD
jgi:hypothetical protein